MSYREAVRQGRVTDSGTGLPAPYYQDDAVTIYHGDCRDIIPHLSFDAVVTDPPYKLSQEYSAATDADNLLAVSSIIEVAPALLSKAAPGTLAVVFYDTRILPLALDAFRRPGWKYLRALTLYRRWGNAHKLAGWMSTSDFALVFAKPGVQPAFYGPWAHDTFVRDSPEAEPTGHPAQKPLALVRQIVSNVTPPGGCVIDPYAGSATTLVAAREVGRNGIGIEAEERYCELAALRLSQYQEALDLGAAA